ncbi:hypothetical protein, partial [Chryseosolibacter indicus]
VFLSLLFSLMKKVTKKSRHKNASTAQGRSTARPDSYRDVGPTHLVYHYRFGQGKNIIREGADTIFNIVIPRLQ